MEWCKYYSCGHNMKKFLHNYAPGKLTSMCVWCGPLLQPNPNKQPWMLVPSTKANNVSCQNTITSNFKLSFIRYFRPLNVGSFAMDIQSNWPDKVLTVEYILLRVYSLYISYYSLMLGRKFHSSNLLGQCPLRYLNELSHFPAYGVTPMLPCLVRCDNHHKLYVSTVSSLNWTSIIAM